MTVEGSKRHQPCVLSYWLAILLVFVIVIIIIIIISAFAYYS
jgi:hypothetical protein